MPTDFKAAIKTFLADRANQEMLQRLGAGAAVGAGGMALHDLLQGSDQNETIGDRAGSLGRSMLLGGAMGGLGGLGYDQLDKHFLRDPSKIPGTDTPWLNQFGKFWHPLRQVWPDVTGLGVGAVARGGYEGLKHWKMPGAALGTLVDPKGGPFQSPVSSKINITRFLTGTPGGWSDASAQAIANHLKNQGSHQLRTLLGNQYDTAIGGPRRWLADMYRGGINSWRALRAKGVRAKNWTSARPKQIDTMPGMISTRAVNHGNFAPAQNPILSHFKDLLAKSDFLRKKFNTLRDHRNLPILYRTGSHQTPTAQGLGRLILPQHLTRGDQITAMMNSPKITTPGMAIAKATAKGGVYGLLAQQALEQLGRRSFDQLALTPEAAAELAKNPAFRAR